MVIILPLPPDCLQPNRITKVNRYKLSKAIAKCRGEAEFLTRLAGPTQDWPNGVTLRPTFYFRKGQNKLDDESATGWLKAVRDGIADGLGLPSDRRVITAPPIQLVDAADPRLEVEVVDGS